MAGELQVDGSPGINIYCQIRTTTGTIWNTSSLAFESYNSSNVLDYDIPLTEQGTASGFYVGTFPALSAEIYTVIAKARAGSSPAESDLTVAEGDINWNGSEVGAYIEATAVANAVLTQTIFVIGTGSRVQDSLGAEKLSLTLKEVLGALFIAMVGDRIGVNTAEVIATLGEVDGYAIQANRISSTQIRALITVPAT